MDSFERRDLMENLKEKFKWINFQIAFLTEQLKDETDKDIIEYISSKIRTYEKESKQLARNLMKFRYKSRIRK